MTEELLNKTLQVQLNGSDLDKALSWSALVVTYLNKTIGSKKYKKLLFSNIILPTKDATNEDTNLVVAFKASDKILDYEGKSSILYFSVEYLNDEVLYNEPYLLSYSVDNESIKIEKYPNPNHLLLNKKEDDNMITLRNPHNEVGTEEMDMYVADTLKILKNSISMTLGPYAKTTIVEDRMKHHSITKDGYTVLRSLCFEDDISRTIFEIVLKVSKTLVRKVGDGSTSSIVIAYYLYENIIPLIKANVITSKDILDIMNDIAKNIEEIIIKDKAKSISDDMHELKDIASISCNNDKEYGELIMNIFQEIGRYGFINLEKSLTDRTYYELKNGFEIPRGYISELMANQSDKTSVVLEEPKVLMIDGTITEKELPIIADFLGTFCAKIGASAVIVASGYSNEASTFFHMNRLNAIRNNNDKLFSVVAIDVATKDKDNRNKFEDLAINLGCKPIRLVNGDSLDNYDAQLILTKCGSCKQFKGDELNSKFIDGDGDEKAKQDRVKEIKEELEKVSKNEYTVLLDDRVYQLRKRMALLQNSMATLYVGGNSEQEKDTDKFLLEDAVSACKSALKYGYVYGGNLVIPTILKDDNYCKQILENLEKKYTYIDKKYLSDILIIIFKSFLSSFSSVLHNCYGDNYDEIDNILKKCLDEDKIFNLKLHDYEDLNKTGIINSAQTDIEIMNTAISIIGLVATSNQFIGLNIRNK